MNPTAPLTTVALVLALLAPTVPAVAEEPAAEYFVTAYDGTVWEVTDEFITPLTWDDWQALGAPAPQPAPTDYVKYAWSPAISAVTFFGSSRDEWVWQHLTYDQYRRAGSPTPRLAGWIEGSFYYQWGTSSELFVEDVGGSVHKLTYSEWRAADFPSFEVFANAGFVKLSWDASGTIGFMCDLADGRGSRVTYSEWRADGFPTPRSVKNVNKGTFLYARFSTTVIRYVSPFMDRNISYAEWVAAGRPAVGNMFHLPGEMAC